MAEDEITLLREALENRFGKLSVPSESPRPLVSPFGRSLPFKDREPLMQAATCLFTTRFVHFSQRIFDRTKHPIGVLGGTPGLGKTRALLEIGDALAAAEAQRERWMVNIFISYNNGNPPSTDRKIRSLFDNGLVGAEKAFLLRVLYFTFFPRDNFVAFAFDFPVDRLKALRADHVIELVYRIAQEQFGHANGTLLIAVDEVNYLLDADFDGSSEKRAFLRETMISFGYLMLLTTNAFVFGLLAGTIVHPITQVFSESSYPIELLPMGLLSHDNVESFLDDFSHTNPRWSTWRTCRALRVLATDFAPLPRLAETLLLTIEKSLDAGTALENVDFTAVVASLHGYLPKTFESSRFAERIVRDALLCRSVERVHYVDAEKTITYSELERCGTIALTVSPSGEFFVQLPFAFFRYFVSNLNGNEPFVQVLRSLCDRCATDGKGTLNWQGFEEMHMNMEALREMLLVETQGFIDCQAFYCVDSQQISVGNGVEIKLRKAVTTGIAQKRFPCAADVNLSLAATRINDGSLNAQVASITNAPGAAFDTFSIRDVRGMRMHQPQDAAGQEGVQKKARVESLIHIQEEKKEEESEEEEEEDEEEEDITIAPVLFCGQQKFYRHTAAVSKDTIRSESEKVSDRINNRMPHILTIVATKLTNDALTDLPPNCVVLSGAALWEFYGPVFSSRMALFAESLPQNMVNANTATKSELLTVPHIGPTLSKRIMDERQKGAFNDWKNLRARVNMLPKDTKDFFCF